jgi:hypothetical protein
MLLPERKPTTGGLFNPHWSVAADLDAAKGRTWDKIFVHGELQEPPRLGWGVSVQPLNPGDTVIFEGMHGVVTLRPDGNAFWLLDATDAKRKDTLGGVKITCSSTKPKQ